MALKLVTCNVKGLNSVRKRWLALKEFKASKADIILVQETHFRPGGSLKFASKHFPTSFLASDPSGKAGVAILINRLCPLQIKSSYLDPHGRFIILDCMYLSQSLMIVNVYAPNSGQVHFLTAVFDILDTFFQPFTVIGGDFNMTMSPSKDRHVLRLHLMLIAFPNHFGNSSEPRISWTSGGSNTPHISSTHFTLTLTNSTLD